MTPLESGQRRVMRIHALIVAAIVLAIAIVAELVLRTALPLPPAILAGPAALLLAYPTFVAPGRRFRAWGYRMDERELAIAQGVVTKVETIVPLSRVQHIDIAEGPIERANGVCRLIVHTAGTLHSRVVLPGLSRPTAEAMRDAVRRQIGDEDL